MSELYYVQEIRKWRYNTRLKCKEYLIKWHGYPDEENTWEPQCNLACPIYLREFERKLNPQERTHYECANPHILSGFQRNAEFVSCVGADGPLDYDNRRNSYSNRCSKNLMQESNRNCKRNKDTDTGAKHEPFYCLIMFQDSEIAEEISIDEFHEHQPEAAFQFLESRLWLRIVEQPSRRWSEVGAAARAAVFQATSTSCSPAQRARRIAPPPVRAAVVAPPPTALQWRPDLRHHHHEHHQH